MKQLVLLCALVGASFGIVASCGPERSFCPNNPPEYNCLPDAGPSQGGQGGTGSAGPCPNGGSADFTTGTCKCTGPGITPYTCSNQ